MKTAEQILQFAHSTKRPFSRQDVVRHCAGIQDDVSAAAVTMQLARLANSCYLQRLTRGHYQATNAVKESFRYEPNNHLLELNDIIKRDFPFAEYCIWKPSMLATLMQHVAKENIILIDIKKDAAEAVFLSLKNHLKETTILFLPTKKECEKYIGSDETIIIRTLKREAPVWKNSVFCGATIEKMLVDAAIDKEVDNLQGAELHTIFENAFERFNVNKAKLFYQVA